MKRFALCVFLVLLVVIVTVSTAVAGTQPIPASVTVSEIVSVNIVDLGTTGILFGDQRADNNWKPESEQSLNNGAVRIDVLSETNVFCDVKVAGSDFAGAGLPSIPISNAKWSFSTDPAGGEIMTTSPTLVRTVAPKDSPTPIFYFVRIPTGTASGLYTSTFTFDVSKTGS
ncbi:MAG: hypothetical protein ACYC3S_18585 [Chloroflexota bacterium]